MVAGTAADVMAGGVGAAGPAPDVQHQPPDIYLLKKRISQNISEIRRIPPPQKYQFLGYPGISLKT